VLIFNWLYDVAARRPPLPLRFHRELIDKINQGSVEDADHAMRQHIRYGIDNVVRGIAESSEGIDENVERGKPSRSKKVPTRA
jgi:DNA-binding GntR family transcriptional regulator